MELLGKYVKVKSYNKFGIVDYIFKKDDMYGAYGEGALHINLNSGTSIVVFKDEIEKEIEVIY